jgi:hypothetical protein
MRGPALGDVVVRARGLANHLLDRRTLLQLARTSGSGALAGALEHVGYWPAPTAGGPAHSAAEIVNRSIEYETLKRLSVLTRWLAERVALFAGLFELELRDALRIRLRALTSAAQATAAEAPAPAGWPELRNLRTASAHASNLAELIRALGRLNSPYAAALAAARRAHGDDLRALETVLDRTWASRALAAAPRAGDALSRWAQDEIDLHNAWDALAGGTGPCLAGGRWLPQSLHAAIALEADPALRRRRLGAAFQTSPLAGVFDASELGPDALEARARALRIAAARRAARLDPIGASPILEIILRLWAERADLRCISWGIAASLSYETITARLVAAP